MKASLMKRVLVVSMLSCVIAIASIVSYYAGKQKGAYERDVARLPIDMLNYVYIHELNDYIYGESSIKPPHRSVRVELYALLNLYDALRNHRFLRDLRSNAQISFEKARRYIEDIELVTLADVVHRVLESDIEEEDIEYLQLERERIKIADENRQEIDTE